METNKSYFQLFEFVRNCHNLANKPTPKTVENINLLCAKVLDPLRDFLGKPITITSGYRCKELNKIVGGVEASQHLTGKAADIQCAELAKAFAFIRDNLQFDQLIWEGGTAEQPRWIHVSYDSKRLRNEVIIKIKRQ